MTEFFKSPETPKNPETFDFSRNPNLPENFQRNEKFTDPFGWRKFPEIIVQSKNKINAYANRFYEDYEPEDFHYLSTSIYQQELDRAKDSLYNDDANIEAKLTQRRLSSGEYLDDHWNGLEIATRGRRYAIPMDLRILNDRVVDLNIHNTVVSVLEEENWPMQLRTDTLGGSGRAVNRSLSFEVTPEIKRALKDVADNTLINDLWYLAIFLGLGETAPKDRSVLRKKKLAAAFNKFDINTGDKKQDEKLLRTILKSIGLEAINTRSRLLDDDNEESGYNSFTEVDSLLEAIDIRTKRHQRKTR